MALCLLAACTVVARYVAPEESCHNGVDDDLDGLADCEDPECACEDLATPCRDFEDNDHDGLSDAQEPICWQWSQVTSRADTTRAPTEPTCPRTCSSLLATHLTLDDLTGRAERTADGIALHGGEQCAGLGLVSETCEYLHATRPISGGPCWSMSLGFELVRDGRDVELAVALAPDLDLGRPPLGARRGVVIGIRRVLPDGERLELRTSTGGEPVVTTVDGAGDSPLLLQVGPGSECEGDELLVELLSADGTSLTTGALAVPLPEDWTLVPLAMGVQAAAPGTVLVERVAADSERFDPCGYPVPQITGESPGDDSAFATVLAVARSDDVVCVVGGTPEGPLVERRYDPRIDHASPPELDAGDPPPASVRFASWRAAEDGLESFTDQGSVEGPFEEDLGVRSAALAWDSAAGRFEGIVLSSSDPRAGGELLRVRSTRCTDWQIDAPGSLQALGPLHPVLYEVGREATGGRRLVLAKPAEGYSVTPWPECPDRPVFEAPDDRVPRIRPKQSECADYARSDLVEVVSDLGDEWEVSAPELASLPAFERWDTSCGCSRYWELRLPDRSWPATVTQLIDDGGYRAFLASGHVGLELAVDDQPDNGFDGQSVADARLLARPLLAPSGTPGTFDATEVRDGALLLLDRNAFGEQEALLFYRGLRSFTEDERVRRYDGGAVGVVPVRFERDFGRDPRECDP